jgi:hypothetical protein
MIVYASNKRPAGDGTRVTRISGGGQKIEVLVDPKDLIGGWSELILVPDANTPPVGASGILTFVGP